MASKFWTKKLMASKFYHVEWSDISEMLDKDINGFEIFILSYWMNELMAPKLYFIILNEWIDGSEMLDKEFHGSKILDK